MQKRSKYAVMKT